MSIREKPIEWRDTSLEDLKTFPIDAIKHFGYELGLIQNGLEPSDFKPMPNLGSGVMELRKRTADGAYSFQKKTQKTTPKDMATIKARYAALVKELQQ